MTSEIAKNILIFFFFETPCIVYINRMSNNKREKKAELDLRTRKKMTDEKRDDV